METRSLVLSGFLIILVIITLSLILKKQGYFLRKERAQEKNLKHNILKKKNEDKLLALDNKKNISEVVEETDIVELEVYNTRDKQKEERPRIVGLIEPKGFWSRFIMSQKLGYIMARTHLQQKEGEGFWITLLKAYSVAHSKEHVRNR